MHRILLIALLLGNAASANEIKLLSWNVESNRSDSTTNDPTLIANQLAELQSQRGPYDLITLTEVRSSSTPSYESAVEIGGIDYHAFSSQSGGSDRMMLLARRDRFELPNGAARELVSDGNGNTFPGGDSRRPFVVKLRDRENNGLEFLLMVNHLTRGNALNRQAQAKGLREWARLQNLPIVAAGDYNFDFDFRNLTGNQAMSIFMRREANEGGAFVWNWLIPGIEFEINGENDATRRVSLLGELVDTNWYGDDHNDSFRDSLLDFVFVAQGARQWKGRSNVVVRAGDFPDDNHTSDHRPIEATLDPNLAPIDVGGPRD